MLIDSCLKLAYLSDMEQFFFFWGGPASQWYKCKFTIEDIEFTSAEQYMMYRKAMLFGDTSTASKILSTNNPKEQKSLGRSVVGFNDEIWKQECKLIVYRGNWAKFTQNPTVLQWLLDNTTGKTLVEASPYDTIWGIGLLESDPLALDRNTWQGLNWLGEIITAVRTDIISAYNTNEVSV